MIWKCYSELTLEAIETQFNIIFKEQVNLFENIVPVCPSSLLEETLKENLPLALEISTKKARSELIIAPILVELRKHFNRKISFFSGTDFSIDSQKGLTGRCDFLISHSPKQFEITAPVCTLVEAKNDNQK